MSNWFEVCLKDFSIQYRRLNETLSVSVRGIVGKGFKTLPEEVSVVIMSLKVGNLGLNMVATFHLLMLDLRWNPTTKDQAIDQQFPPSNQPLLPCLIIEWELKVEPKEDRVVLQY